MKLFALDTSTTTGSIAILDDEFLLAEITVYRKINHCESLMPAVVTLFSESGLLPEEIDLFATTNGPGSFTGLRIGISPLKGMAW